MAASSSAKHRGVGLACCRRRLETGAAWFWQKDLRIRPVGCRPSQISPSEFPWARSRFCGRAGLGRSSYLLTHEDAILGRIEALKVSAPIATLRGGAMVQLFAATYLRVRGVALMASIRMRKVSIPSLSCDFARCCCLSGQVGKSRVCCLCRPSARISNKLRSSSE